VEERRAAGRRRLIGPAATTVFLAGAAWTYPHARHLVKGCPSWWCVCLFFSVPLMVVGGIVFGWWWHLGRLHDELARMNKWRLRRISRWYKERGDQ
jgi:hypothetical protein